MWALLHQLMVSMLVLRDDVALDKKGNQIPIVPQFLAIDLKQLVLRLNDCGPLFILLPTHDSTRFVFFGRLRPLTHRRIL